MYRFPALVVAEFLPEKEYRGSELQNFRTSDELSGREVMITGVAFAAQ
jgi:hypothetical protein